MTLRGDYAPQSGSGWQAIGRQLSDPRGWGGRLVGQAMRIANRAPIRAAIDALDVQPGDGVMDLGCGPGSGVAALARLAKNVYDIDRSPAMVAAAARLNRAAIKRGRVTIARGDFACIPFAGAAVDNLLAANVAYLRDDPKPLLAEIRRVVRPGGRMAIYVTEASEMARWKFASAATHRHFTAGSLVELLLSRGFDRLSINVSVVTSSGVRGL